MKRFLGMLIGGLCVGLGALFGGLGAAGLLKSRNGAEFQFWIVLVPFIPWIFLISWMARLMEKRTRAALDTLVHNLVQAQER
jgi:TM2 domain-containing membrane protein YozV